MNHSAPKTPHVLPYASPEVRQFGRIPRVMLVIAWAYPLTPLAALYMTWLVAWIVLGHQPRPSLDDPKSISALVGVLHLFAISLVIIYPVGLFYGLIGGMLLTPWWVQSRRVGIAMSVLLSATLCGLYVGGFLLLRWNPADVLIWLWD